MNKRHGSPGRARLSLGLSQGTCHAAALVSLMISLMMTSLLLVSPGMPCRAARTAHPAAREATRSVILSPAESRLMPGTLAKAYWTPTPGQVRRLEADLRRRPQADGFPLPLGLLSDYRQYMGVVVGGRRLIYVNGFRPVVAPEFTGGANDWHRHPVFVSDGGNDFFHVTYDPRARRFTDFDFNGQG